MERLKPNTEPEDESRVLEKYAVAKDGTLYIIIDGHVFRPVDINNGRFIFDTLDRVREREIRRGEVEQGRSRGIGESYTDYWNRIRESL